MNQLQVKAFENEMFGNMHGYVSDGTAYLNVEESAFGLGFTAVDKSGYEKVAWALLNRVLKKFGYPKKVKRGDYIPENVFYRLAMKADNESAEDFQAWIADDVIPAIRKTGMYSVENRQSGTLTEHAQARQFQLQARKEAVGVYEMYAQYARRQGDIRKPKRIYAKFSNLANRVSGIPNGCRALATKSQKKICGMTEKIISESLIQGMTAKRYYRDIENSVMDKAVEILQMTASSNKLLEEPGGIE